ncbi:phosphocholine cytidylyltransferase family protein [Lachnospiraceae bacterium 38-10]
MKAIILAAGQGTRLKKYTENLPKGMLNFAGKTIIEWQIEMYRRCGIEDIIIVRGFAGDKIRYEGVKYYTNKDFKNTNMVESFMTARSEFDDDIIVSYSDILFEKQMLEGMIDAKEDFVVAVDDDWKIYWEKRYNRVDFDTESLVLDKGDNIVELGLESPPIEEIDARYIGLLKFSKTGLNHIITILNNAYTYFEDTPWKQSGKPIRKAYMTDLLQAIIDSKRPVKAKRFNNGWIEFDTNEDYENACSWVNDGSIGEVIDFPFV